MGIVDFNTSIWKDPWFRKLPLKAKILFIFLWTNDHKNLACIYEMDVETMSFYTGMGSNVISETIQKLYPKVKYDFDNEIVWVTNFVRHQFMRTQNISPKIVKGIENNLVQINGHFFIKDFLEEYQSLNISYPYPIDTLSEGYAYPPGEGVGEDKGNKGGVGGEENPKKDLSENKSIDALKLYNLYVKLLDPEHKSRARCIENIIHYLSYFSYQDLEKTIMAYGTKTKKTERCFIKDPANFFGKKDPKFSDYLHQETSQIDNIGITICRDCKKPSDTLTDGRCDSCIKECG